ncbi:hypothetical protein VULLAG_LOCUS13219 [Vulpes lagopus]
MRCIPNHIL